MPAEALYEHDFVSSWAGYRIKGTFQFLSREGKPGLEISSIYLHLAPEFIVSIPLDTPIEEAILNAWTNSKNYALLLEEAEGTFGEELGK